MNARLAEDLDDRAFSRHFAENVAQIETLFWEIIESSGIDVRPPFKRRRHSGVSSTGVSAPVRDHQPHTAHGGTGLTATADRPWGGPACSISRFCRDSCRKLAAAGGLSGSVKRQSHGRGPVQSI